MPHARTPDGDFYYEWRGPADGEPLVLIHGFTAQMVAWHPGFVQLLAEAGFRVLAFDNRGVGLSPICADENFTLGDMAGDVSAILDAVGVESAHIVGQSMGGMIAQRFAIDHPSKTQSLVSIYSCPDTSYLAGTPDDLLTIERHDTFEDFRRSYIDSERRSAPSDEAYDPTRPAELARILWERSYHPEGHLGQARAILADDRSNSLGRIAAPTAVIHGRDDRLIHFTGGFATASAIPDAEMHLFAKMGHEVDPARWDDFVRIIRRTADRGGL